MNVVQGPHVKVKRPKESRPRGPLMNGAAASAEDDTMARQLRAVAIKLGRQGDSTRGERVKKPTSLLATVHAVLTQRCAPCALPSCLFLLARINSEL